MNKHKFDLISIVLICMSMILSIGNIVMPKNKIINGLEIAVVQADALNGTKLTDESTAQDNYIQTCSFTEYEEPEIIEFTTRTYPYTEYEIYELAKIIMCEAEGESQECKEYVGQVVINRVNFDEFPDNIHDVIFQNYQFTPTIDGRWESVEPDEDSYNAAYAVINMDEPLTDALYFEACNVDSWQSKNLIQVAEIDNTRFYIE